MTQFPEKHFGKMRVKVLLESFAQRVTFFVLAGAFLSKLVSIGAKGAIKKILGFISQKWISQISAEGTFCVMV